VMVGGRWLVEQWRHAGDTAAAAAYRSTVAGMLRA